MMINFTVKVDVVILTFVNLKRIIVRLTLSYKNIRLCVHNWMKKYKYSHKAFLKRINLGFNNQRKSNKNRIKIRMKYKNKRKINIIDHSIKGTKNKKNK